MNSKDIDHITERTLQAWDGMEPAEVSPFLWTRISANLLKIKPEKGLIAQPAMQLFLGIWIVLIVVHVTFWLRDNKPHAPSASSEVRTVFFSDDNPYSSY